MWIVIELQANGDTVANLVTQHPTLAEAYSKYYAVLSAAATSTVEKHSAALLTDKADMIAHKCFEHEEEE